MPKLVLRRWPGSSRASACSAVFADQAACDPAVLDRDGESDDAAGLAQRGLQLQALVRAVAVIVLRVLGQERAEMPLTEDQRVIATLAAKRARESSARESGCGDRAGVWMTRVPFPAKTASNAGVNLLSRSRIKNVTPLARSPGSIRRVRACRAVQAPAGSAVTLAMCTARVRSSSTNRTYPARCSSTVTGQDNGERNLARPPA